MIAGGAGASPKSALALGRAHQSTNRQTTI